MNDEEMRRQIHHALDHRLSGMEDSPWLARRITGAERKQTGMNKKIMVALVLCLTLLLAFAGVAAALNLNVFELFSSRQPRLQDIAAASAVEGAPSVTVENERAGRSVVTVTNAYYDGESLLIGYTVENEQYLERFTPTEEELAQMEAAAPECAPMAFEKGQEEFAQALQQAVANGTPFGVKKIQTYIADHTMTDGGVDLGPSTGLGDWTQDGTFLNLLDYDELPNEVRNQPSLTVLLPLRQTVALAYWDGQGQYYFGHTEQTHVPVTLTVRRTAAEALRYEGKATVDGVEAKVEIEISVVKARAAFTALEEDFHPLAADGPWYELRLKDDKGWEMADNGWTWEDDRHMSFAFTGNGALPSALSAQLLMVDGEEIVDQTEIALAPVP